jgi:hypothetical protein
MKTCPADSGIKNQATGITTVAGTDGISVGNFFKVAALHLERFKALRAAA